MRKYARSVVVAAAAVLLSTATMSAAELRWVGTWATSSSSVKVSAGGAAAGSPTPFAQGFENQTLRTVVPTTIGGSSLRLRLSNLRGERTVRIEDVTAALAEKGPALKSQTLRKVRFSGHDYTFIPAGGYVYSDPVSMSLEKNEDLAVSVFVPAKSGRATTGASGAMGYVAAGNVTGQAGGDGFRSIGGAAFLVGVDVMPAADVLGSVVAFGDSITAGGRTSWPGALASRFDQLSGQRLAVLNFGIGGMRLLRDSDCFGESGLARFDEVIAQPNVKAIVVFGLGGNDIRLAEQPGGVKTGTELGFPDAARACWQDRTPVAPEDLIDGLRQLVVQAHDHAIRIYWTPITPFRSIPSERTVTKAVNDWATSSHTFDGTFDTATPCTDPSDAWKLAAVCDSGDNLHPSPGGSAKFAGAIDLKVLLDAARSR